MSMDYNIFFSFLGSATGCIAGILASQKLTNFRLEQLEEKVNRHNNLVERMAVAERDVAAAHRRIDGICQKEELYGKA